jgi:hypothetical protein
MKQSFFDRCFDYETTLRFGKGKQFFSVALLCNCEDNSKAVGGARRKNKNSKNIPLLPNNLKSIFFRWLFDLDFVAVPGRAFLGVRL